MIFTAVRPLTVQPNPNPGGKPPRPPVRSLYYLTLTITPRVQIAQVMFLGLFGVLFHIAQKFGVRIFQEIYYFHSQLKIISQHFLVHADAGMLLE